MSKKFKGKLCVYCAERVAASGDHVFAKAFFLPEDRDDLPQVPACQKCNGAKSELEHYLTALLPFGGRHEGAKANLGTMVPKRLQKNRKLTIHLAEEAVRVWSEEGEGLWVPALALPIEPDSFESLFAFVARGLIWYHWRTYLTREHSVRVVSLTTSGERFFDRYLFGMKPRARVSANLGDGTFVYEGVQGEDCPQLSVWRFSAFGGVKLIGDPNAPNGSSSRIGVVTGPARIFRRSGLAGLFRDEEGPVFGRIAD